MKKLLLFTLLFSFFPVISHAEKILIQAKNIALVINVENGKTPEYVYFGSLQAVGDVNNLQTPRGGKMTAYPAFGLNATTETALAMRHADGNMSTELVVTGHSNRVDGNSTLTTINLKDPVYNVTVDLNYRAYHDVDMIEAWTTISNHEKGAITLTQFASAMLPIRRGDVWLSHLSGAWANEARVTEEPLLPGQKIIENKDGVRNSQTEHAEVMFSLDGKAQENSGDVIGAALCYSGNYRLKIETDESEYHYFFAGINEENSSYQLKKGETFTTPALAFTYSREGLSGASRNFHHWGRTYKLAHGNQERMILLNSWEGVSFNIKQEVMNQMMGDFAALGGELFVMDDGWFGDKYPRKNDHTSLGDWTVDKQKLPEGIEGLLRSAKSHGLKFGLWIEPEMANTTSKLYEKHPDWIIKAPQRASVLGRGGTQVVLDMGNLKVQDYVFSIVDNLMTRYPDLAYIKWDANMSIMNFGSQYLPLSEQSHLYINYHRGLTNVLQRIRDKYPNLIIQACASGGGRANWGVLPWFDEFWVSDNTDALQRVYMQWGTSYFFPSIAMASHISDSPNQQTSRSIPLKYRIDVAMSGRLGMEMQPKSLTNEEREQCKRAIAEYKEIRPVVQFGNIYRLMSPYEKKGLASLMYVDDAKERAVFYWWKTESFHNEHLPRIKMAGLNANAMYRIHELNRIDDMPLDFEGKSFSGAYLMEHGLELPYMHRVNKEMKTDWSSRVLSLSKI